MAGKPKPYKKMSPSAKKKAVARPGSRTKRGTGGSAGVRSGRRPLG